jgi:SsrA-binding protein
MADLLKNSRATFDYELGEQFSAGLELHGHEVKTIRAGRGSLRGARVAVRGGETYLLGAEIPPYQPANATAGYDPTRPIKLLLNKKEIARLAGLEQERGLTLIPLAVYNTGGKLKLRLAVARGKKKFDKRQSIKKRETDINIRRTLKSKKEF